MTGLISQGLPAGAAAGAGLIPAGSAVFHLLLAVHIPAGLICVATGAIAALRPKRHGRHPQFGTIYYWALAVVVATAAALAVLRWPEDAYLLILGTLSFGAASIGRTARRRRQRWQRQWRWRQWRWVAWVGPHITGMSASYILLLVAFYVDNGKNLPVWQNLPHVAYWLLPSAIGTPLLVRALLRHRALAAGHPHQHSR